MKKCRFFCWTIAGILTICQASALGQEEFVPKPAEKLASFSFYQLSGGVILLRATLDHYPDTLNFILDTGSGGISLDSTTVEELKIPNTLSEKTIRGIAGMRRVNFAYNHSLCLPGLAVDSLDFHINNYELLGAVYGLRIDGIIGYSFLKRYIVTIDYEKLLIEVFTPGTYKYPRGGHMLRPTIAGLPMQYAQVSDNERFTTRFFLDTGAGLCLLLSEEFCRDSSLLSKKRKRYTTITEGLGGKKEMDMTVLKEFKIGPYKFKKVPIFIFEDEFNVTAYPYLAGLIGNDLLRRFNTVINYPAREFHLLPNAHMREPFDYSYSGMGLYAFGNEIIISDVVPGSPADEAGLRGGDVVIGMENNLSNNIFAYKNILQSAGSKIKIIVRRDDELIETKMSIKSIR